MMLRCSAKISPHNVQNNLYLRIGVQRKRALPCMYSVTRLATTKTDNHLFVFGLGYTGWAIASSINKAGWTVSGTCRELEQQERLTAEGLQVFHTASASTSTMNRRVLLGRIADIVLQAPIVALQLQLMCHYCAHQVVDLLALHATSLGHLKWVGYLSSTSIYGDWDGDWVDESCAIKPQADKAVQRAKAEAAWLNLHHQHSLPVHCFRLGGIYGPGRSALDAAQQQLAGKLVLLLQNGVSASQQRRGLQKYTARCHVQDICKAVTASMHQPHPGSIYNVVDDNPASRAEVMAFARQLLGLTSGPVSHSSHDAKGAFRKGPDGDGTPQLSAVGDSGSSAALTEGVAPASAATQKGVESASVADDSNRRSVRKQAEKRVSNKKVKMELQVAWDFPSYVEGLSAIHSGGKRPLY